MTGQPHWRIIMAGAAACGTPASTNARFLNSRTRTRSCLLSALTLHCDQASRSLEFVSAIIKALPRRPSAVTVSRSACPLPIHGRRPGHSGDLCSPHDPCVKHTLNKQTLLGCATVRAVGRRATPLVLDGLDYKKSESPCYCVPIISSDAKENPRASRLDIATCRTKRG